MTEISGAQPEISRREAEMYRVDAIQDEMASAVRLLGGNGPAKEQNNRAARAARLSVTTIERLRWKKIRRPFADIVDQVREAVARHTEENLIRAKHEQYVLARRLEAVEGRLLAIDPDFYGPELDALRRQVDALGR